MASGGVALPMNQQIRPLNCRILFPIDCRMVQISCGGLLPGGNGWCSGNYDCSLGRSVADHWSAISIIDASRRSISTRRALNCWARVGGSGFVMAIAYHVAKATRFHVSVATQTYR